MKRVGFILLLLLAITCQETVAQSKSEQAIRVILSEQTAAWNIGELENFMNGYWNNDSLMFIGKSGVTYGYDKTLANYRKGYPDKTAMGTLAFTLLKVEKLSSKYYFVVGKWHLTRTIGDVGGHYTLLFKKIKGQWVIIADHSS